MKLLHLDKVSRYIDYDWSIASRRTEDIFLNPLKIVYIKEVFVYKEIYTAPGEIKKDFKTKFIEIRLDTKEQYEWERLLVERELSDFRLEIQEALYGFKTEMKVMN